MMYTAFCDHCDDMVSCSVNVETKNVEVRGVTVVADQMIAYCAECGEEVFPNEIIDFNVEHAHDAYRDHVRAIRSSQIKELLDLYDIGAEPLSLLLEWGPNTIARQMKHVVPDREHSNRLQSLFDVATMEKLVAEKGHLISRVAKAKIDYRIKVIKGDSSASITEIEKELLKQIPYSSIRKVLGMLPDTRKTCERILALRDFFHVPSLDKIRKSIYGESTERPLGSYAFRMSTATESGIDVYGLAAWLRAGEDIAARVGCDIFDPQKLNTALPALRECTCNEDISKAWHEVVSILKTCGVKLVAVPYVPKTKVNGAVKWINGTPVIALSAKGARADVLWFTLFHEIGHILLHGDQYMDVKFADDHSEKFPHLRASDVAGCEIEADAFARTTLIPDKEFERLTSALKLIGEIRKDVILRFAQEVNICPDVVIGRMCHEGLCSWDHPICRYRRQIQIN